MKSKEVKVSKSYIIRLERGEDVISTLTAFCAKKKISSGSFKAIGAVEQSKIGYYNLAEKKYGTIEYPHAMEVVAMVGNVALVDKKPFIHVHTVLSDMRPGRENQCIGGHVFEAKVAVTLEIHLTAFKEKINREFDEKIGLKLLDL